MWIFFLIIGNIWLSLGIWWRPYCFTFRSLRCAFSIFTKLLKPLETHWKSQDIYPYSHIFWRWGWCRFIRFDREFQTALDQISHRAHTELLALMIKQQEKNLAADNQAIKAQQQLLQNLHPSKHSFQASRNQAANRARPRPRPRTEKTHNTQQTCNFASMQAQLS